MQTVIMWILALLCFLTGLILWGADRKLMAVLIYACGCLMIVVTL